MFCGLKGDEGRIEDTIAFLSYVQCSIPGFAPSVLALAGSVILQCHCWLLRNAGYDVMCLRGVEVLVGRPVLFSSDFRAKYFLLYDVKI